MNHHSRSYNPPLVDSDANGRTCSNVRLRDFFAGLVAKGIVTDPAGDLEALEDPAARQHVAAISYAMADALLAERAK